MKINRSIVESYLGQKVEITLFNGMTFVGELHKTGEESYKNNPNLYNPRNYYFLENKLLQNAFGYWTSGIFRSSHIKKIQKVIY